MDCTQTFGHLVHGNHHITGKPMFIFFKHEVYNPVYFFFGISKFIFKKKIRPLYFKALFKFVIWCIASLVLAIGWNWVHEILSKYVWNIHGTARFATKKDLKKNGLLKKQGVICGQLNDAKVIPNKEKDGTVSLKLIKPSELICHPGKLSTLILLGTGEGKGVSYVISTLLSFGKPYIEKIYKKILGIFKVVTGKKVSGGGSVVVVDPKGENFNITSGWRRTFSRVLRFAPCDKTRNTVRINPVMYIKDGDTAYRDAALLASCIFSPPKIGGAQDGTTEYFNNKAIDLLCAALLHVRFSDYEDKSLAGVLHFLTETSVDSLKNAKGESNSEQGKEQCLKMIETEHQFKISKEMYNLKKDFYDKKNLKPGDFIEASVVHDQIVNGATRCLNTNSKERATVFSSVFAKLKDFEDETLAYATSGNDFEIEDFINSEVPISLYLVLEYSDFDRIAPVFRILICFMLKKFSEGETQYGQVKLKNNVLFLLDEFPALGTIPQIAENMGVLRGYGVFFVIICQALNQLVDRYGPNHPFLDHCNVHIVGAPGSPQDAELYSKAIGQESIHQEKVSRSGQRLSNLGSLQFSDNDMGRNLLDAADIMRLPSDKALIRVKGMQPYISEKVVYYMDKRFKNKLNYPAPKDIKELYKELAGLPSRVRIKQEIEERKKYWESMMYLDLSDISELDEGDYIDPDEFYDDPIEDDIIQKMQKQQVEAMNLVKAQQQVPEMIPEDTDDEETTESESDSKNEASEVPASNTDNNLSDQSDSSSKESFDFA